MKQSHSAPGAEQLSSWMLIPDSRAAAGQGVKNEVEPSSAPPIQSGGAAINRRHLVRSLFSIPAAAAIPAIIAIPQAAGPADPPHLDAKLFELVDRYIAAEKQYAEAAKVADHLEFPRSKPPEVLRIRPRDIELGCKNEGRSNEFWTNPCDIQQWRDPSKCEISRHEDGDTLTIITRAIPPSEELAARAAEIVAAYDVWWNKRPRGRVKANRDMKRAQRRCEEVRAELCQISAVTLAGLRAKLRCLEIDGSLDMFGYYGGEPIMSSILEDIQQMATPAA